MLGTRSLEDIDINRLAPHMREAMCGEEDEGISGYLVIGMNEQILGGGIRRGAAVVDCWGVTDLQSDHWMNLIHPSSTVVQIGRVRPDLVRITRKTLDRYSSDGHRRIAAEMNKARGYEASLAVLVRTVFSEVSDE
jgi:hypothetical protein